MNFSPRISDDDQQFFKRHYNNSLQILGKNNFSEFFSRSITFFSFTQVIERLLLTKSSLDALTKIPCGLEYECFLVTS